jgi:glycosyltransferase involved in cell wall biosynthesis
MRVALLSHNAQVGDAVGQQVAAKAAFFRERGADLQVFLESDRRLEPALRPYLRLAAADVAAEWVAKQLHDFDLLCVEYSQHYHLLDALPLLSGKRPRILLDYYGVTPPNLAGELRGAMRTSQRRLGLVWFADEIIVHSEFMRRELVAAAGFPPERIHRLPLCFEPLSAGGNATLRNRRNLQSAKLLLFVGRLAVNKRVPILIEAVSRLKEHIPNLHAAIVGDLGDVYQAEHRRCVDLVANLGLADRVHFLGRLSAAELVDAYRCADLFVMPSRHEGFCMPVIEAMAHGVPVIAAAAGALPETLAGAGLSCVADDPADLARHIQRVLTVQPRATVKAQQKRIAVVTSGYGSGVLGGAERSLRLIAESLAAAGCLVDVFAGGPRDSVEEAGGLPIHRYSLDRLDERKLASAVLALRSERQVSDEALRDYLAQTRVSSRLLTALEQRAGEFHTIIAGPYASGLAWEVARRFPTQMLLLPCFHDEPLARQPLLRDVYSRVGGLLFHSAEEQALAQIELGIHHPNSEIIGTWLPAAAGNADRGRRVAGTDRPYLAYCGRYCREKNLPEFLDWWRRYDREHPDRFAFVCTGRGQVPITGGPRDLGFLSEHDRQDVVAAAAALLQPSVNESLSLAALEAWNEGVPIISHAGCAVVVGHLRRCGGGRMVDSYEQFRDALNDLHAHSAAWRDLGHKGAEYIRVNYGSEAEFARRLEMALTTMDLPLAEQMRRRGLRRAAEFTPVRWAEEFAARVDSVLDGDASEARFEIQIVPRTAQQDLALRLNSARLVVQLQNTGNRPLLADGPGAATFQTRLVNGDAKAVGPAALTRLPDGLLPGRTLRLPLNVLPANRSGEYALEVQLRAGPKEVAEPIRLPLRVVKSEDERACDGDVEQLRHLLTEAETVAELPAGYTDVSEGKLAAWKRRIKRKLLHQFQTAYVDVLSRQQTAFNRSILSVLQELAECTAMLERHMAVRPNEIEAAPLTLEELTRRLSRRVREAVARIDEIERRLAILEARAGVPAVASSKEGRE